jgi:hypothetical protein
MELRLSREDRTFKNLCDDEIIVNQSGPTRWNTLEVAERTERRFEITRCFYHELTTAMGIPELTPVICQIDNAPSIRIFPMKSCSPGVARGIEAPTVPKYVISNGISSDDPPNPVAPNARRSRGLNDQDILVVGGYGVVGRPDSG